MSYANIAWIILGASLLFLFAAFNPSAMAFAARTPEARLEIIHKRQGLWVVSQYAFAIGAIVAALGYVIFARQIAAENALGGWLTLASGGMLAGALLWASTSTIAPAISRASLTAGSPIGPSSPIPC